MWGPCRLSVKLNEVYRSRRPWQACSAFFLLDLLAALGIPVWMGYVFLSCTCPISQVNPPSPFPSLRSQASN